MLSKLFKYEMKAVSKLLIILHLGLLILTFFERIIISLNVFDSLPALGYIFSVVYVLSLIAVAVTTFIFLIYRFYKNMFADEGYLMHTLPVSTHELLISKLLVSFIWSLIDGFIFCGSILVLFLNKATISQLIDVYHEMKIEFETQFQISFGAMLTILILYALLAIFYNLLRFYSSIAIGHTFGRHKILGSVAAYIGIYVVIEVINTILLVAFGLFSIKSDYSVVPRQLFNSMIAIGFVTTIVFSIILYVITQFIMKRKLNLE